LAQKQIVAKTKLRPTYEATRMIIATLSITVLTASSTTTIIAKIIVRQQYYDHYHLIVNLAPAPLNYDNK